MTDSLYHHFEQIFWHLLGQVPAPGLVDEHWFLRELDQASHPDPELSLHWAVLTGELTLCTISATGAWQLALTTTAAFATPPLYRSAGQWAQTATGETYQPLVPAQQRHLAQARFLGYAPGQSASWHTLGELADLKRNTWGLPVYFGQGRLFDGEAASLLPEVGALALSFEAAALPDAAWYQLTEDPYLGAHWLLLAQAPRPGQPLTAVVQVPSGPASREQALEALAHYCRRRFQRLGCRCQVVPRAAASKLAAYARVWLHPALRLASRLRDVA